MHAATLIHTLRVIPYERSHTNEGFRRAEPGLIVKSELDNFSPAQVLLFGNRTVVASTPAAIPMPCSVTSWDSASTAPSKVQCSGVINAESLVGTEDKVGLATPYYAAKSGRTSAVKWLLGRGASAMGMG